MPSPRWLAPLAVCASACLHGPPRTAAPGSAAGRFDLDAVSVAAPAEPGWTSEEGGVGPLRWIRFQRGAAYPADARQAVASQVPLAVRPGSPVDFLDQVQEETRQARGQVESMQIELTRSDVRVDTRFGPLTVVTSGRGLVPGARRGAEAVLYREYTFVLPERPDRRYRMAYLEVAPEWSPGTGFEERAEGWFAGVTLRRPEAARPAEARADQALAAGGAVARLRGLSFAGVALHLAGRSLQPVAGGAGGLGLELALDAFIGRSRDGQRGASSLAASALVVRSRAPVWAGAGLDLGYAALTHLPRGPRTDGLLFGPHLAAGLDHQVAWGAFALRLDLLAATPRYYRGGALLGLRWP